MILPFLKHQPEPELDNPKELVRASLAGEGSDLAVGGLGPAAESLGPDVVLDTECSQLGVVFGERIHRVPPPQVILLGDPRAADQGVEGGVILEVLQLRQADLLEVEVVRDEGQLEVSEERPGVPRPLRVVVSLDELHDDADERLLPLDGGQHCAELGVEDDPVTLDALGEQLHRQLLELGALNNLD